MVVVQYQNYYLPGFGLVAPCPFQKPEEIPCKGTSSHLGGPWLQVQPGSGLGQRRGPSETLAVLPEPGHAGRVSLRCLRVTVRGLCLSHLREGSDLQATCSQRIPPEGQSHCSSSEHHCGLKVNTKLVGIALIPRGRCAVWTWLQGPARQNRLVAGPLSLSAHWEESPESLLSPAPSKMSPFLIEIPSLIG